MNLCRKLLWNIPNGGVQYSRIEEIDRIYDVLSYLNPKFDVVCGHILDNIYDVLADLNPKFDVVRGHILGQRLSLMEVYSDGTLDGHRAKLVVKGFIQIYEVDY